MVMFVAMDDRYWALKWAGERTKTKRHILAMLFVIGNYCREQLKEKPWPTI